MCGWAAMVGYGARMAKGPMPPGERTGHQPSVPVDQAFPLGDFLIFPVGFLHRDVGGDGGDGDHEARPALGEVDGLDGAVVRFGDGFTMARPRPVPPVPRVRLASVR